jgi:3-keto-5-aminohexanoate cleavage enzyme
LATSWSTTKRLRELRIKPEGEAFDLSMIYQAAALRERGLIEGALHGQLVAKRNKRP